MIFVNSMSDLFHEAVPAEYIWQVFAVMGQAPWSTISIGWSSEVRAGHDVAQSKLAGFAKIRDQCL